MKIETLVVGPLATNCYIVTKGKQTIVIDPGDEVDKIINSCVDKEIVAIFITHYHFDHIGALKDLQKEYNVPINPSKLSGWNYEIISTKGHKDDAISIYFPVEKIMFVGDFIFLNSIGRTDLPGGNFLEMQKSLKMISKYDDDITLYPGHGPVTNLGQEKRHFNNYF